MERTIFDIMNDHPSKIADFEKACDEMLASQYILVGGRISSILMSITASKTIYDLMDRLLQKFDYKRVAKNCMSGGRIQLPDSIEDATALVFCVLLDMDRRNIELKDFLQLYQGDREPSFAYRAFLAEFVAPFKNNVLSLLEADKNSEQLRAAREKEEIERGRLAQNFDRFMGTFVARIGSDDSINSILKDDLTVLCSAFMDAVHIADERQSKATYTQLRGKLRLHMPALAKELEKLGSENY